MCERISELADCIDFFDKKFVTWLMHSHVLDDRCQSLASNNSCTPLFEMNLEDVLHESLRQHDSSNVVTADEGVACLAKDVIRLRREQEAIFPGIDRP